MQVSQEADQVVRYSHLFQNFPHFIVIHTVKGFGIVNKAEIDVFLELSCFFHDPADVGNLIDRVPDELWNEVHDIVQETGIKTIPMEKKCKKAKWLSGEGLQIAVKRREVKSKGEKGGLVAQFSSIQLLSRVQIFATTWTVTCRSPLLQARILEWVTIS